VLLDDREQIGQQLPLDLGQLDPVDGGVFFAVGDVVDGRAQRRDQPVGGVARSPVASAGADLRTSVLGRARATRARAVT
jgi:hypothetical protein